MKWAAGIIFYDDKKSLERCLESIYEHLNHVICVDGRFKKFDSPHDLSTDGSREIVLSYSNTLLVDVVGKHQPDKRNRYLELSKDYGIDILLVIDSDQYAVGDFQEFQEDALKATQHIKKRPYVFGITIRNEKRGFSYSFDSLRLYYQPALLRMHPICHYYLYDISSEPPSLIRTTRIPKDEVTVNRPPATVRGIELHQNDELRNEDWRVRMFNHQKWQVLYEMQWHYRDRGIMKDHVQNHGFDAVALLLEKHPFLSSLMMEYEYREVQPNRGFIANPELADFVIAIGEYFESHEASRNS
ncbi:MAG: glycosyltransferase family A protein [Candidatus Thorarchaeota archaeon]|jgi:hypothetical protein